MAPLVVVVGETASGKSALAMKLAECFNGEIICADSWTVYKGFDIGTAKPSSNDQLRVPHHLLDVADPVEGFSAVEFQRLAKQVIADIFARRKLPILVGGTGLYIDSVLYDYGFLPKSNPGLRAQLNDMQLVDLLRLASDLRLDASGVDARNKRRIIRLIESNGAIPTKRPLRDNTLVLGVAVEREQLRTNVEARVGTMLAAGLEDEVRRLAGQYGWEVEPMKGIGYREWREYFEGSQTHSEVRARILKGTLDLAKRQRTWFKRNDSIQWIYDRSKVVDLVTTFLNKTI